MNDEKNKEEPVENVDRQENPESSESQGNPENPESQENPASPESQEDPANQENKESSEKPENSENQETSGEQEDGPAEAEVAPSEPDWKNMYARMRADFENFRKRTERDRADLAKFAAADVLKDVLATVDNLARALDGAKDKKDDPFVSGVQLVYDGLLKTLADHGATPLDSMGEPFDANYHEALATLPSPDVPEGNVMTEVKRGWLLNGRLLRAAQVVVSAGKAEG